MKIGVIQASSQAEKNLSLYHAVENCAGEHEVINFGCFEGEGENYSYIDISVEIGLLLTSGAIDFVVTGCSSGQGMMLACNNMPGVLCGYTPTPQDAYLFGRINNGNAVSVPLGLNYGWAGEINLRYIMEALFSEPMGTGYPPEEAERKQRDARLLKKIGEKAHVSILELMHGLDAEIVRRALQRRNVVDYILRNGSDTEIRNWLLNLFYENDLRKRNVGTAE